MPDPKRCTYPGCAATTARPATDGWKWFQDLTAPGPAGRPLLPGARRGDRGHHQRGRPRWSGQRSGV